MTTEDHKGRAIATTKFKDGSVKIEIFQQISEKEDVSQGAIQIYSDEILQMAMQLLSEETSIDSGDIEEELQGSIEKLREWKKQNDELFSNKNAPEEVSE